MQSFLKLIENIKNLYTKQDGLRKYLKTDGLNILTIRNIQKLEFWYFE